MDDPRAGAHGRAELVEQARRGIDGTVIDKEEQAVGQRLPAQGGKETRQGLLLVAHGDDHLDAQGFFLFLHRAQDPFAHEVQDESDRHGDVEAEGDDAQRGENKQEPCHDWHEPTGIPKAFHKRGERLHCAIMDISGKNVGEGCRPAHGRRVGNRVLQAGAHAGLSTR